MGITFGSSPRTVEAKVGQRLTEVLTRKNVMHKDHVEADYLLKQPFRTFTKVCATFDNLEKYFGYTPMKNPEGFLPSDRKPIVVLRKLLFMGSVDLQETSRASCLEELAKVKDLLAEKFDMKFEGPDDCLKSESCTRNGGPCVGIELRFKDGFEMEVEYGVWKEAEAVIKTCMERAKQKAKEADLKKATIGISNSAGKDQL